MNNQLKSDIPQTEKKPLTKVYANWLNNTFMGMCKKRGTHPSICGISPEDFGIIIQMHYYGIIDRQKTTMLLEDRLNELHCVPK